MNYLLLSFCEGLCFLKKRDKYVMCIAVFIAWFIFTFNFDNPDIIAYQEHYYGVRNSYSEPLYCLFQEICFRIGISFQAFVGIEAAIGLTLTVKAIDRLSPYTNAVFGLYMIYPFFIDVVQVRSFFAQSLILLSVSRLLEYKRSKNYKNAISCILLLAIAVGFHYSAILFAPICILLFDRDNKKAILYCIVPIAILLLPFFINSFSTIIIQIIGLSKTVRWIEGTHVKSLLGMVKILLIRSMLPAIILLLWRMTSNNKIADMIIQPFRKGISDEKTYQEQNRTLLLVIVYLFSYITMEMFVDGQYNRIARTNLVLEYILCSRLIALVRDRDNVKIIWVIFITVTIFYTLDALFFITIPETGATWFDYVFKRVFGENIFWKWLLS